MYWFLNKCQCSEKMEDQCYLQISLRKCFHNRINYHPQKFKHADLNPSRIKKDEDAVQKILSTIEATFIDQLSPLPLISISTGITATDKGTSDMMFAKAIGN